MSDPTNWTVLPIFTPNEGAQTKLNSTWSIWAQKKPKVPTGNWHEGTSCVGSFNTIEGFWAMYSHLVRPDALGTSISLMVFRDGIKPLWEDPENKAGGRFVTRIRKTGSQVIWETLLLSLIGEFLEDSTEFTGIVLGVRYHEISLALWTRSTFEQEKIDKMNESLSALLHLPPSVAFDFRPHRSKGPSSNIHSLVNSVANTPVAGEYTGFPADLPRIFSPKHCHSDASNQPTPSEYFHSPHFAHGTSVPPTPLEPVSDNEDSRDGLKSSAASDSGSMDRSVSDSKYHQRGGFKKVNKFHKSYNNATNDGSGYHKKPMHQGKREPKGEFKPKISTSATSTPVPSGTKKKLEVDEHGWTTVVRR